jgi:hypothetical protein
MENSYESKQTINKTTKKSKTEGRRSGAAQTTRERYHGCIRHSTDQCKALIPEKVKKETGSEIRKRTPVAVIAGVLRFLKPILPELGICLYGVC